MKNPISRRKLRIKIAILLVVAIAGWAIFTPFGGSKDNAQALVTLTRATIEETVTAQGKLEPKEYVDVGAQVSGQLQRVFVEIGEQVKKGQLMAEIDPKLFQAQVEVNEARLTALNAQIEQQKAQRILAQQIHTRNLGLIKLNAVSKEAVQTTKAELDAATASLASLKAQAQEALSALKGAQANLGFTKIYAPISGTVTSQTTREGQTINSNQTAPNIMQVANLDVMTVRAQVAEADISRITAGMEVYFTTLGSNDKRWQGTVRQILPTPVTINDVVLYEALVDVENKDHALMTGMSTQMFFVIGKADDALVLPFAALRKPLPEQNTPEGLAYEVEVKTKDGPEKKTVIVGMTTRTQAEILSGLSEGDAVLMPAIKMAPAKANGGAGMPPRGPQL